jgi:phosphatidylglycerophosphatase A
MQEPRELRSSSDRTNWLAKAKSRAFVKTGPELANVSTGPLLLATFFYSGLSPVASGTVGSLIAAILYYLLPGLHNVIALIIAIVVCLIAGIWSSSIVERELKVQDPGIIVIDEVLGQWIALVTIGYAGDPVYVLLAFLAFRFFDIVKLWPARIFERMHGGVGIMLDDAVAGVYAWIAAHLAMYAYLTLFHRG